MSNFDKELAAIKKEETQLNNLKKEIEENPVFKKKYDSIKELTDEMNKKLKDAGIDETVLTIRGNSEKLYALPDDLYEEYM